MARKRKPSGSIYQLKITLMYITPPIWRRILVPADVRLDHMHWVLQAAMGWENDHMHQFIRGKTRYGERHSEWNTIEGEMVGEAEVSLSQVLPAVGRKLVYEYDFGDSWKHEIVLEKRLEAEPGAHYPRCVTGRRSCPPEDCGGAWGYEGLLEAINDPDHEAHEDRLEWIGGSFDPEAFDLETVNRALARL